MEQIIQYEKYSTEAIENSNKNKKVNDEIKFT